MFPRVVYKFGRIVVFEAVFGLCVLGCLSLIVILLFGGAMGFVVLLQTIVRTLWPTAHTTIVAYLNNYTVVDIDRFPSSDVDGISSVDLALKAARYFFISYYALSTKNYRSDDVSTLAAVGFAFDVVRPFGLSFLPQIVMLFTSEWIDGRHTSAA